VTAPAALSGRHRGHRLPGRPHRVTLRFAEEEYAAVAAAAREAGLTITGYTAQTAVAVATESRPPAGELLRAALSELMQARSQVRRFAVNVNQALVALHAEGEPPEWLGSATALTGRAVARLDAAAAEVVRRLP
jgi:hypothetical protein